MTYAESPYRATCPRCESDCGCLESFLQATRQEPMRSLGWQGYCRSCDCSFSADPQFSITVEAES